MKSEGKFLTSINQNQLTIFKVGVIQLVLLVFILLLLLSCNQPSDKTDSTNQPTAASIQDSVAQEDFKVDPEYVVIAAYYPEETKQKLRELEKMHFEKGTLADQLLNFLKLGENDLGEEFKFIDLHFESKSTKFNPKFGHEIPELATILALFPNISIVLKGHTDSEGEEKSNEKLSLDRLKIIKNGLISEGIKESRVKLEAYGEQFPVANNKSFEGRLLNNRIEMMILNK